MYVDFDITDPLPNHAIFVCEEICKTLKNLNIVIRPSDGTLLGLLRDGCLIKHDNDLDFDILASNESVLALQKGFDSEQLTLVRKVIYKKKLQQLTYRDSEGVLIDFIFWWGDRNLLVNFCEPGYIRVVPRKFLAELKNQIIDGHHFPVPLDDQEWLRHRYGDTWAVPQSNKGDWRDDCNDLVSMAFL